MLPMSYSEPNDIRLYDKVTNLAGAEQQLEKLKEIKKEQDDLYIQLENMPYDDKK